MNTGQIKKSKQTERFTVIPNSILENKTLSLKAIGLLCYLLRLPSDWVINKTSLHKNLLDGRDAVLAAFKELEKAGYIKVEEVRERGRFLGFNYEVSDFPQFLGVNIKENSEKPLPEKPETDNPETVPPITGNPESVNPKSEKPITENTELLNTNSTKDEVNKGLINKTARTVNGHAGKASKEPELFTDQKEQPQETAPRPQKSKSTYQRFIDIYDQWHKDTNDGMPPVMDGKNGTAAKSIISHLTKTVKARAEKDNVILDEAGTETRILESWQYILNNWEKLDLFLQGKTRLIDINSNLQNIITQIKKSGNGTNGTNKAGINGNHTGKFADDRTTEQRFSSINEKFSSWENDGPKINPT